MSLSGFDVWRCRYVDFNNMPRLKILRILSDYATDNKEKEQLLRYCDEEKEAFAADQKSLFEVLCISRS